MSTIDLVEEPRGAQYVALLHFLGARSLGFALVWRDGLDFGSDAEAVRIRLAPFELRTERVGEWPGTQLLGGLATVRHYASSEEALRVLADAVGLFSWRAPVLPEDLSFYAPDGRLLFASIAHERDAWFAGDAVSVESVRSALPDQRVRVDQPSGREPDI